MNSLIASLLPVRYCAWVIIVAWKKYCHTSITVGGFVGGGQNDRGTEKVILNILHAYHPTRIHPDMHCG